MLDAWFNELFNFEEFKVSPLYVKDTEKDFDKLGCLIDRPEETMRMFLMNMDVEANSRLIMRTAKIQPDPLKKPLLATWKGWGTGKTRGFEEVRRRLFYKPDCFTMGITFTNEWDINDDEVRVWLTYSKPFAFMMSVFVRMASIYFNVPLDKVINDINNHHDVNTFYQTNAIDNGKQLIQDFILYMIHRCGRVDDVKTVVVLVDDIYKASKTCEDEKVAEILHKTLLDSGIMMNGNQLNVALGISTLHPGPLCLRNDGREIKSFLFPNALC